MGRWPLLLVVSACAGPLPPGGVHDAARKPPDVELEKPWAMPGETMEMTATLRGITVGRIAVAVGQPGVVDGHRALIVRARGQSAGMVSLVADVAWEQTATIDLDTGITMHAVEDSWEKLPGHEQGHQQRTLGGDGEEGGSGERDVLAAVGAVRAWRSRPGDRGHLRVWLGGGTRPVELTDAGHAYLASAHEPAVRYEGTFDDDFHFTTWVSDDVARVPLRFEAELDGDVHIGRLVIELSRYDAGITE